MEERETETRHETKKQEIKMLLENLIEPKEIVEEMRKLRELLDAEGIEWEDDSSLTIIPIARTKFEHRGYMWSVINGYGSYGGFSVFEPENKGLLELMSNAVNGGEPVGWLTAEEAMYFVRGE